MLIDKKNPEYWKKALAFIGQCPICNQRYDQAMARLFANKNNVDFIHITCSSCKGYFVAMVMLVGKGVSTVGMVTDLSLTDVERLYERTPLTVDEIIEAHQLLKSLSLHTLSVS